MILFHKKKVTLISQCHLLGSCQSLAEEIRDQAYNGNQIVGVYRCPAIEQNGEDKG